MIPTRTQIKDKIDEIYAAHGDIASGIATWLDSIACPAGDKVKILSDLGSYS